jgi:folate-binding protein YgfZ
MAASKLLEAQTSIGGITTSQATELPQSYQFCDPPVLHFGDPQQEYRAAKDAAVVFDLSDRSQIEMTGSARQRFLHNYCTNDIKQLQPGRCCEAFVTNAKSRILGHVYISAGDESIWIDSGPGAPDALIAHLAKYIVADDVQLHDRSCELGQLLLSGPASATCLAQLGSDCESLQVDQHITVDHHGSRLHIRRIDLLGQVGLLLSTARTTLVALWEELIAAGASAAGAVVFHACRIESGLPLYGLDLSAEHLAPEAARNDQAISFTKGCYMGQEPIARIASRGHVNRELRSLRLHTRPTPKAGDIVLSDEGEQVGVITSSAVVPGADQPIALAFLRNSHIEPDTAVLVRTGNSDVPATMFWRQ